MGVRASGDRWGDRFGVVVKEPDWEIEREDIAVVGEAIRQLRDLRDRMAADRKEHDGLRDQLMHMLGARGGRVWDETSGLEAVIATKSRWEWDAQKLRETGELRDADIADCLVQSVDKKRVQALIEKGARERLMEGAKVQTKSYEVIEIKEMGKKSMRNVVRDAVKEARNG